MKISLSKRPAGRLAAKAHKTAVLGSLNLNDNQDDTFTVEGVDEHGSALDISGVASITNSSDNTALMTVDAPIGVTSKVHGILPTPPPADGAPLGTANLVVVATWNDGSFGPFTITVPVSFTHKAGSPTGIQVDFGTPTIQ